MSEKTKKVKSAQKDVNTAKKTSKKTEKSSAEKTSLKTETVENYDPWKVLINAHLAEKSMGMVEFQNKLTFIVARNATKNEIAEAVEKGFQVKVKKVNVELTQKGLRKAYVTLSPKHSAADIATRLGMI